MSEKKIIHHSFNFYNQGGYLVLGYLVGCWLSSYVFVDFTMTKWLTIWPYFWIFLWPLGIIWKFITLQWLIPSF